LSQWLGTDLDYNKIQNLLVEADDDLKKENTLNHWWNNCIDWMIKTRKQNHFI
jgi:hypothetical protein